MNRPKREDYLTSRMYREALERYCDELEKQYNFTTLLNSKLAKDLFDRNGTIVELENALEKAIDMLDLLDSELCFLDDRFERKTKEEWKAWALKDD